jgi:hypothetical protein
MRRIATLVVVLAAGWPAAAQAQGPDVEGTLRGCDPLDEFACLLPFPNDFFTKRDASTATGRRLSLPTQGMPRNAAGKPVDPTDINRGDGFSPGSMIVTKVPGLDSQAALEQTGAVPITDMARYADADAPVVVIDAETGERHPIWVEIDSNPADPANRVLIARPARNFEEGRRYIVALRNLKDASGSPIEQTGAFRRWRDKPAPARSKGRRAHFETIFAKLAEEGVERSSLYLAWDFTVASAQSITGRMLHIRDESFAMLGDTEHVQMTIEGRSPQFTVTSVTNFTPQENDRLARRVDGTVRVPCWLSGGADCGPGNRFLLGPDGTPLRVHDGYYEAPFRCNVPRVTIDGPGASPGRPSLYGHGLFGSLSEINQSQLRSLGNEHNFVFCATDWKGMSSEDVVPTLATIVPDLSNFPQLTDRAQQGMLNFLYLGRAMVHPQGLRSHPAFQDEGQSVIGGERLYYDGNSQGGIIGPALTAVAIDYDRAVHGVPGMNYSTVLQRSIDFVGAPLEDWLGRVAAEAPQRIGEMIARPGNVDPLRRGSSFSTFIYAAYPDETTRQLMFATLQLLWDRAEANGYAHHLTSDPLPNTPPHEILLHVGHGDHQVADVSAEVMARTAGMHVLRRDMLRPGRHTSVEPFWGLPEIPAFPFAGSALVSWDIGPWRQIGDRWVGTPPSPTTNTPPSREYQDPHEYPRRQPAARRQKNAFLAPGGQVVDTCDGGPCDADPTL